MKFILLFLASLSPAVFADQDADFLAARDAYRAGNQAKLAQLAKPLKNHPLEIYLSYYQLKLVLDATPAEPVLAFLARPEDSPLIDAMRSEWLKVLGRQHRWELFNRIYPSLLNEDAAVSCYAMQAYPDKALPVAEVRALWLTGKAQPDSCGEVFNAAFASGLLSEADAWQRFRLSLEAGNVSLARDINERLSEAHQVRAEQLTRAAADADRYLSKAGLDKANEGARAVALFALQRLAKQSPDLALSKWQALAAYFTPAELLYFYATLGYEAARQQDPRALQWYKLAGAQPLNDAQAAWRARAALRLLDWAEVLRSINAMSVEQRRDPAWRYWQARSLQALNKPNEAMKLFAPLSDEFNFYGQLANTELSNSPSLSAIKPRFEPKPDELASLAQSIGAQRTLALYRLDLRVDARLEWIWLLRNFNDQELLSASEFAKRNEMFDRAIGAAEKTVFTHDFSLRYMAPYRDALQAHIVENGLEEAWVFGLMRQESRFASSARSPVGAQGLMQIMPSTARWVAKQLGLKSYRDHLIAQLDTNLKLGTFYMKNVLDSAGSSPVMATAAYNAGPGRARKWRGEQALEGAIYAETIPFDETRDYVKKVMSNTHYYAQQFGAPTRSLKDRMGVIAGKTAENQRATPDEK
ncbi:MAG: transglycosylase SLT domain-containing protein [Gallionella sp.]